MRFYPGTSNLSSATRAVFTSATALAFLVSCSDSFAPSNAPELEPNFATEFVVPDSIKQAYLAGMAVGDGSGSYSGFKASLAMMSASSACHSAGESPRPYTFSRVPFAPEPAPANVVSTLRDDGFFKFYIPIGFDFEFYGNTYDKFNLNYNGFITFGPLPVGDQLLWKVEGIAALPDPNNMIALAWADWNPLKAPGSIRYETRGTAPNRRFILQFTNVPEVGGSGRLTSQLVLAEGSNEVTIHTTSMSITAGVHRITQGIENADGTDAAFDSVQNAVTGVWSNRVRGFFNLSNDAVRFSAGTVGDEENPSITPPDDITQGNDPGLASAVVAVSSPVASDNCSDVEVSSVRSDGVTAMTAPYPVGLTTITWTAKDAAGNTASATQTVTVLDVEAPVFPVSEQSMLGVRSFNATSPSGAVVTYRVAVTDNVGVTSLSCEPASGSVFPIGSTLVSCLASDAAANSSSNSFSVLVIGPHEQLASLLEIVIGYNLPNGTAQPLINQLRTAYREPGSGEATCKKLSDFITLVEKRGSSISSDESEFMIGEANRIMAALGCADGSVQAGSLARLTD